ncbi:kinase-like protein [Rickenella mellea]|uniref:Kinase-like protein n=1 Tax=Rickenella mellea TaxID=50990 RepID=A0A4Y7Q8I1_9AGAM|nr:kinase-like protein [Rickenella mellea]
MTPLPRIRTRRQKSVEATKDIALTCARIAMTVAPLPFTQAAALILQEVITRVDAVKFHRAKSKLFQQKCLVMVAAFESDNVNEGPYVNKLAESSESLKSDLIFVYKSLTTIANYDYLDAFIHYRDIRENLDACDDILQHVAFQFHIEAHLATITGIQDISLQAKCHYEQQSAVLREQMFYMLEQARKLEEAKAQIGELLTAVNTISSDRGMQAILETEPELAQQVLAAGEIEARFLREDGLDAPEIVEFEKRLKNLKIPQTWANITKDIEPPAFSPDTRGLTSKIYSSTYNRHHESIKVALKSFNGAVLSEREKRLRRFTREVIVWSALKQRNIVPFYGVCEFHNKIYIVSQWQDNMDLRNYIDKINPNADRLSLLHGAAQGIEYLHNELVWHGNVKCSNILVSGEQIAKLCDFRLSHIIDYTEFSAQSTQSMAYSHRWTAPERYTDEDTWIGPTPATDIYSLAMTILECITLRNPFDHCEADEDAIAVAKDGDRPHRPSGPEVECWLTDELWDVMQQMWHQDPIKRGESRWAASQLRAFATAGRRQRLILCKYRTC